MAKKRKAPAYAHVPEFIRTYAAGLAQWQIDEAKTHMSNWLKVHAYLYTLRGEISWHPVRIVAKMIELEYERRGGPRMDIVARLYGRFSTLRYEVERVALGTRIAR